MINYDKSFPCLISNKLIKYADLNPGDTVEILDNLSHPQIARIMENESNMYKAVMLNYPYTKYPLTSVIKRVP